MGNGDSTYNSRHMSTQHTRLLLSQSSSSTSPLSSEFTVVLPVLNMDIDPSLIPKYQSEENDKLLPTQIHPSYPFGNPHTRPKRLGGAYVLQGREPLTYPRDPSTASYNPSLALPEPERHWLELAVQELMDPAKDGGREGEKEGETNKMEMAAEEGAEERTGGPAVPQEDSDNGGATGGTNGTGMTATSSESEMDGADADSDY
ncbi:hypothetical protein BT69DRAFT_247316 [Atractiella rhizophila]|nr:hypothetical protein BT69DRAFT_247316 [Atractiella rhizophila]